MTFELVVVRDHFTETLTLGVLSADESFLGYTEEACDRYLEDDRVHVDGFIIRSFADRRKRPAGYEHNERRQNHHRDAAIPRGRYRMDSSWSRRFGTTPEIMCVPEFVGVRIINSDLTQSTIGCIKLGSSRHNDGVRDTIEVNRHLLSLVEEALANGEEVWITVR